MEKRLFGRTGLQVSVLGFGAAPIGYLQTERERVATILNFLLDHGMNVIDKEAHVYRLRLAGRRNNEDILV